LSFTCTTRDQPEIILPQIIGEGDCSASDGSARNYTWQGLASGCNASDPIARDHAGRDQSMIVLPGIVQPGITWRIIGPDTNKKFGPENDLLVSSGVVSPGCVCMQC